MRPVRVLHVVGSMNRAGIETWLMSLTRAVDRREFAFDFLLHDAGASDYEPELHDLGCRIFRVPVAKRSVGYPEALRRCFERAEWDIVHSHEHHATGTIVRAAARAGVHARVAHSHNDTAAADARAGMPRRAANLLNRCWMHRYATAGFAASPRAAAALFGPHWSGDERWRVLFCGVDVAPFRRHVHRFELRQRLGIPPAARVVGHAGRFEEQKNHGFLVDIAREVASRDRGVHFLLAGQGRLKPQIMARIDRSGLRPQFTVLDSRPDVPDLMLGAMDAFLFPSLHEGLGLVLVEAQAAGLPCVISDCVPPEADLFPEEITRCSLTHPPGIWAGAVLRALDRARAHSDERVNAIEASRFSHAHCVRTLLGHYERMTK